MTTNFGPWSTPASTGSKAHLSTFWKRRLTMLPATHGSSNRLGGRVVLFLSTVAALVWSVPTFYGNAGASALATDQSKNTPTSPESLSGNQSREGTIVLVSFAAAPARADRDSGSTLPDIVENVRRNEDLYRNLEVTMTDHYDVGDRKPVAGRDFAPAVRIDTTLRFVRQDGKFRLEKEGIHESAGAKVSTVAEDRIRAFDGEKTRLLDQRAIGNIVVGPTSDPNFIQPHMLLLRPQNWIASLSTWLQGHDALEADLDGRRDLDPKVRLENTYQGTAVFGGLRCHKVWITLVFKASGERGTRRELWLAEDRNYIPARVVVWTPRESKDIPNVEGAVTEWREVKPGIWFPMAATCTRYDPSVLEREGKQRAAWRREYTVKEVSLEPKHDIAFFRDVKFSDGTSVYEIENKKVLKSYPTGVPDAPGGPRTRGQ